MHTVCLISMFLYSSFIAAPAANDTVAQSAPVAKVWYLGANGWAVRINEKVLVFDYQDWTDPDPPAAGEARDLEHGYIDPNELRPFDVYVFVTHSHQDHYDPVIYDWRERLDRITYVFGWMAGNNPEHHYMVGQRDYKEIDGMRIYTIYSHHSGVPESAFLVMVDGYTIYHNGDYMADYEEDYEYLRTITDHIDIAFVIGHPDEGHQYFAQAKLLDELFHPTYMFPMNREGEAFRCNEFSMMLAKHGVKSSVVVLEKRGDDYMCPRSVISTGDTGSEQDPSD